MAVTSNQTNLILGIVLVVLGILVLTGNFSVDWVIFAAAIALIVLGVLIVIKTMPGGLIVGIVAIALGALLLFPDKILGPTLNSIAHIAIGVILLVFGLLKIMGK